MTSGLQEELDRVQRQAIFENRVFFIRGLGFVAPTAARRISHEDALRFEQVHEQTYRQFGFDIVFIEPGSIQARAASIRDKVQQFSLPDQP